MKKILRKEIIFYLAVIGVFLCIVAPNLFSDGMFMDGLFYATISRNMAEGLGSFWYPHLSQTLFPQFHEHPPLALGLQSLWFMVFGDSIYVERFYSLSTFVVTGLLIVLIWKELTDEIKTGWIPLLFWITVPAVSWACANNILENTLSIFICLPVYFYLKSHKKHRYFYLLLSGMALALGLLTKGFVALFPWSLPFWFWALRVNRNFWSMLRDILLLLIFTVLPVILLFYLSESAADSLVKYFNIQVIHSLQNVQTVDTRFAIIGIFLIKIIPPLVTGGLLIMISEKNQSDLALLKSRGRYSLIFLFLCLSGVLPIMISLKQRGFYILAVYPFFALSIAYFLYPLFKRKLEKFKEGTRGFKIFSLFSCLILAAGILLSILQVNRTGRDKNKLHDIHLIIEKVGRDEVINMCHDLHTDWSLRGYFARYANISLDYSYETEHPYFIVKGVCDFKELEAKYSKMDLPLTEYTLYQKKFSP
jgi:4-amino-4-deoxy-L-arabinose transferase-like glycosyltransferase